MHPAGKRIRSSHTDGGGPQSPGRKKTVPVRVGNLIIGDRNPVVVQEMTSTPTADIDRTLHEIRTLAAAGCKLIRVAVPDEEAARALAVLKRETGVLLVADIHFDYRLALRALEAGVDKLRLNPGTMGSAFKVREVAAASRDRGVPIRIGVNSGSLQRDILLKFGGVTAEGLVESALQEVALLEKQGFQDIIVSIKSPDIGHTVRANRLLSGHIPYPLHIGVTEAGPGEEGVMRSVIGLGTLLLEGIGDTVRVSLTNQNRIENLAVCRKVLSMLHIPFL
jgi:(E)-4-hydroxy-3-methylbut-2-enyl-diphosphate synthase